MKITYGVAMAAGQDAANRRMRKAGRTAWDATDYNFAARTVALLLRHTKRAYHPMQGDYGPDGVGR